MFADMLIIFMYTVILSTTTNGLMGFDCGGQRINITSVSLLSVDNCDLKNHAPNSSEVYTTVTTFRIQLRRGDAV